MISSSARCDNCEKLVPLERDEVYDDDGAELREAGWIMVGWQDDGTEGAAEFCSKRCLAVWACVNAREEIGLAIGRD